MLESNCMTLAFIDISVSFLSSSGSSPGESPASSQSLGMEGSVIIGLKDSSDEESQPKKTMAVPRRLKDYALPTGENFRTSIGQPSLQTILTGDHVHGAAATLPRVTPGGRTPNPQLKMFLQICATFKVHGVTDDAIRLKLFPFPLAGKPRSWLNSLPPKSRTTWNELSQAFLAKYYPPSKTVLM